MLDVPSLLIQPHVYSFINTVLSLQNLCVHNDIVRAIDEKRIVGLVLLDLSAMFDTVDDSTLLSVLQQQFGVNDVALAWLQSYLSERTRFFVEV